MNIPLVYQKGYLVAKRHNPILAEKYIQHTTLGDPVLDPVLEELSDLPSNELLKYIAAGIEEDSEKLNSAPQVLRDFFANLGFPDWLDYQSFYSGYRAFHENSNCVLLAFVTGVLVEGFSTLISKSFYMTGRVIHTHRRLRQNNRQLMEIFLPHGLRRAGDGWKLSVRIRFVHAKVRMMLKDHEDWDCNEFGTPISAAHLGYAMSVFSHRLIHYSAKLGTNFSQEEKESILAVWRYTGYVMGIPESILYTSAKDAVQIYNITSYCEPSPGIEAITMANALINCAPMIAKVKKQEEKEKFIDQIYKLSRALLGNKLAEQLGYPKSRIFGVLEGFRMRNRIKSIGKGNTSTTNIGLLLELGAYEDAQISYKLPDHVNHLLSREW